MTKSDVVQKAEAMNGSALESGNQLILSFQNSSMAGMFALICVESGLQAMHGQSDSDVRISEEEFLEEA